jgi:hypothetical protein
MLGISKGAGGFQSAPPPPDVKATISPQTLTTVSSNGSYTSPVFKSTVSNGVGPFTYNWSFDAGSVISKTADKTRVQCSGYNTEITGTLTLTVTDTGDSNKQSVDAVTIRVFFEDQFR